jgi:hypothetical protein
MSTLGHPLAAGHINRASDTEVCEDRVALREQYVLRLDIAVDDALGVRVGQGSGNFACNGERIIQRNLFLSIEAGAKRFALDVWHYVVKEPIRLTRVVNGQYIDMLEVCFDLDLAEKALRSYR